MSNLKESATYGALARAVSIIYKEAEDICVYCVHQSRQRYESKTHSQRGESCCMTTEQHCKASIMRWLFEQDRKEEIE